jgi:hypothetical protein
LISADSIRARVRSRLAEQRTLVSALLRLRAQLQGSLFVRHMECGKPGCACHTGKKHGPYFVLSNRSGGRGSFAYLDAEEAARAPSSSVIASSGGGCSACRRSTSSWWACCAATRRRS